MNTQEIRKVLNEQMNRCYEISAVMGLVNDKYLEFTETEPAAVAADLVARMAQEVAKALDILETDLRTEDQQQADAQQVQL